MRLVGAIGAAVLISALAVPAFGERAERVREGGNGQEKQAQREKPGKAPKHADKDHDRRDHGRPERADRDRGPRHVEPHRGTAVVQHRYEPPRRVEVRHEHRVVWQERRARRWEFEHRNWHARGGYHGYFVPRERYVVWFGPAHRFRVHTFPVLIVAGHPRFQYHGYWVSVVDPWPEYWAPNWYETDDVYVAYVDDGYYLYNVRHPGIGIAVNINF